MAGIRHCVFLGTALLVLPTLHTSPAHAQEVRLALSRLDIDAQPIREALEKFADQTGLQVVMRDESVPAEVVSPPVHGEMRVEEGLERLLRNTGLKYEFVNERTLRISRIAAETGARDHGRQSAIRLAQAGSATTTGEAQGTEAADSRSEPADESAAGTLTDGVIVTGTRLVGVKDQFSPVVSFSRASMDNGGYGTVSELIANLPQNYGGGITGDTNRAGSSAGPGGVSINLRGLPAEATLTLLNGRRLSSGGLSGDFVDISAIPTAAIDRIEVLTDGASAVYGSDAIAGVVNILLREDYRGSESRLRLGTITDGGGDELQFGQTFGGSWDRGHALVSYEYSTVAALDSSEKDFSRGAYDPNELLPYTRRNNLFASGGFDLTPTLKLTADGYFNDRDSRQVTTIQSSLGPATYAQPAHSRQYGGSAGAAWTLPGQWRADVALSYARSDFDSTNQSVTFGWSSIFEATSDVATLDATLSGHLFGSGGRAVRAVIGVQSRRETYQGFSYDEPGRTVTFDSANDRDVNAVFGELYWPVVDAENGRAGLRSLAFSLAGRYEHYSDFGNTFNPKLGVVWSPAAGLNARATYGTSFRAARLQQLEDKIDNVILIDYLDPSLPGGQAVGLWVIGSSADLDPEKSTTWTAGLDFEPVSLPGLRLRATYFDIDFDDRISTPYPDLDYTTFYYSSYPTEPIRDPDRALIDSLVAASAFPLYTFTQNSGGTLDDVTLLFNSFATNLSATRLNGVDLEGSYALDTTASRWTFSLNGSVLLNFTEQFSDTSPNISILNTLTHPVDFRMRAGVTRQAGPLTAALFVNYADNYRDDSPVGPDVPISSWTTFDATLRYSFQGTPAISLLSGTSVSLSVRNVTNEDPPRLQNIGLNLVTRPFLYDTSNADPQGRVAALLIAKEW